MVINKNKLKQFAQTNNFNFDSSHSMIFGNIGGYNFTASQVSRAGNFFICMNLENPEGPVNPNTFLNIHNEVEKVARAVVNNNGSVIFETTVAMTINKSFEHLYIALNSLAQYLAARTMRNCCYGCPTEKNTSPYTINGVGMHLCDNCSVGFANSVEQKKAEHKAKPENIPFGIVGGLLGSLLGVAAIVIIGQLGYVAAISGFILAVCTLKGYEMLSGKMSKIGIVISLAIMVMMTFFGNRLDWAVFAMRELDLGIFDAFMIVPELADPSAYTSNLFMIGLFALIGSIGSIIAAVKAQTTKVALSKLKPF